MTRGGKPAEEIAHARRLLAAGPADVWGWNTPAGQIRVKARARWIIKHCRLNSSLHVLECGCGTGVFTRQIAKAAARVTAVDVSEDLLAEARRSCSDANVSFARVNLEDPHQLPDGAFDAVCGVSVLHHLDLRRALPELRRKLKPQARFAFSEPNLLNPLNRHFIFSADASRRERLGVSPSEMAFKPRELRTEFESAGYVVHAMVHRDFLHPSVPRLLIPLIRAAGFVLERTPVLQRLSGSLWIRGWRGDGEDA